MSPIIIDVRAKANMSKALNCTTPEWENEINKKKCIIAEVPKRV